MRYLFPICAGSINLGFSLIPGNPVGWLSALVFFGCVAAITGMAGYDVLELLFGGRADVDVLDEPEAPARGRDPFAVFLVWSMIGSGFCLAVVIAIAWPLLYLWLIGLAACVGIFGITTLTVSQMGPLGFVLFGGDLIKAAFYVIGAILSGLAESSK